MLSVIRAGLVSHSFYHPGPYTRALFLSMLNSCCLERTDEKHKIYNQALCMVINFVSRGLLWNAIAAYEWSDKFVGFSLSPL